MMGWRRGFYPMQIGLEMVVVVRGGVMCGVTKETRENRPAARARSLAQRDEEGESVRRVPFLHIAHDSNNGTMC